MGMPVTGPAMLAMTARLRPTPLLTYLAGEYATEVAAIWPAPHEGFLKLPAARRHLVAMLIDQQLPISGLVGDRIAERVTFDRDSIVADPVLPNGSSGLMKVLSRAGEVLWSKADYAALLRLVQKSGMTKLLRHRQSFDTSFVQTASALPDAMLRPQILEAVPHLSAAQDVAEAVEVLLHSEGEMAIAALAGRLVRIKDPVVMMDRLGEALFPDAFAPYAPPPELTDPFVRIIGRKQLKEVALAFKNCLRDYDADLASGRTAVYVFRAQPAAVFALDRDARGWALQEAVLAGNKPLPKPLLHDLVAKLRVRNVRVGTGLAGLKDRLHRHVCKSCGPVNYPPWPNWRTELAALAS